MGKSVVALILITNLLICPLRCMASDWGTAGDDGTARSTSACCHPDKDCDDSPSKDNEPENDCSCPNCICEGATLQDSPEVSAVDFQFALANWLIPVDVATECEVDSSPARMTDHVPRCAGGLTARIAFQVWLI